MQETNEEVQFGDILDLTLEKRNPCGTVTVQYITCKFLPELVQLLLEEGIIVEKEIKEEKADTEKESKEEFDDTLMTTFFNVMDCMMETLEELELRMDKLEKKVEHFLENYYKKKEGKFPNA